MNLSLRRLFSRSPGKMGEAKVTAPEVSETVSFRRSDLVEKRASLLWNAEGRIPGRQVYYWHRAEEEIAAELGERQVS